MIPFWKSVLTWPWKFHENLLLIHLQMSLFQPEVQIFYCQAWSPECLLARHSIWGVGCLYPRTSSNPGRPPRLAVNCTKSKRTFRIIQISTSKLGCTCASLFCTCWTEARLTAKIVQNMRFVHAKCRYDSHWQPLLKGQTICQGLNGKVATKKLPWFRKTLWQNHKLLPVPIARICGLPTALDFTKNQANKQVPTPNSVTTTEFPCHDPGPLGSQTTAGCSKRGPARKRHWASDAKFGGQFLERKHCELEKLSWVG